MTGRVERGERIRKSFQEELDQLRIQVELMGVKVDQNLERMREVMADGSEATAATALDQDDQDLGLATDLVQRVHTMDVHYEHLMAELLRLTGGDAVAVATSSLIAGRSLERIADHAAIIGARLRYLLTGDPDHLSAEVR